MVTPDVHEVASALHESRTVHDMEADSACKHCDCVGLCRAAGACQHSFGGILSLVPGSPEYAAKAAARAQLDAERDGL